MTDLLRFEDVALRRGGRLLFEGMSFALGPGDGLQITGPNGSGKSSLLRLAAGLLTPERGSITRTPLALADEKAAFDRERTLGDALRFWSGSDPAPSLDAMGLAELATVPVRLLSSGQLKRVTIARVAGSGRALWLLDEPLNALDPDGAMRLADLLARHRSDGGTVLAASHLPLPGEWPQLEIGR